MVWKCSLHSFLDWHWIGIWAIQKKKKRKNPKLYKTIQLYKDYVYLGTPPHPPEKPHSGVNIELMEQNEKGDKNSSLCVLK